MFNLLETILQRLDRHERLLNQIAEKLVEPLPAVGEDIDDVNLPQLPCESREALQELNTLLEDSGAARKKW